MKKTCDRVMYRVGGMIFVCCVLQMMSMPAFAMLPSSFARLSGDLSLEDGGGPVRLTNFNNLPDDVLPSVASALSLKDYMRLR